MPYYITLHYITYITLHYITLHTLHYITLHYITRESVDRVQESFRGK
jgi:hypothetical protein